MKTRNPRKKIEPQTYQRWLYWMRTYGITQQELETLTGLHRNTISNAIAHGLASEETLIKLDVAFNRLSRAYREGLEVS